MNFEELLSNPQYSMSQREKEAYLIPELAKLTEHHSQSCPEYARIAEVFCPSQEFKSLAQIPMLPVGLFKRFRLKSIPEEKVFKTMTSSGTTGQQVSQIILDTETAQMQSKALAHIMTHVLGPKRLPMLIIGTPNVVRDRKNFSPRGAGVLGMMTFGRRHAYALDDDMNLQVDVVNQFLEEYGDGPFLMFGFTFMVWKYFYQALAKSAGQIDLSQGILIHSGGWKKLIEEAVDNSTFKQSFKEQTGLGKIYNFYGMVEQVGSVFLEGEDGFLYPPTFADVIVRDPITWEEQEVGKPGVIQVLSALPWSYPGHSILTEDMGVLEGVDDSSCGRKGKYFSVQGRVPKAELRGCSDTHAADRQKTALGGSAS